MEAASSDTLPLGGSLYRWEMPPFLAGVNDPMRKGPKEQGQMDVRTIQYGLPFRSR